MLPNRFNVSRGPQLPLLPNPTTAGCVHLHDGMPKQRDLQREVLPLQLLRRADVLLHGVMTFKHFDADRAASMPEQCAADQRTCGEISSGARRR